MTSTTSSKNIKVKNFGAYFRPSFFKNINKHFTRSNVNRQLKEMNILLGFNSNSSKKSTATSKSQFRIGAALAQVFVLSSSLLASFCLCGNVLKRIH